MPGSTAVIDSAPTPPEFRACTVRQVPNHRRLRDILHVTARRSGSAGFSPAMRALLVFWGGGALLLLVPGAQDAWLVLAPFGLLVAAVLRGGRAPHGAQAGARGSAGRPFRPASGGSIKV